MSTDLGIGFPDLELGLCDGLSLWLDGSPPSSLNFMGKMCHRVLRGSNMHGKVLLFLPLSSSGPQRSESFFRQMLWKVGSDKEREPSVCGMDKTVKQRLFCLRSVQGVEGVTSKKRRVRLLGENDGVELHDRRWNL
jgi:hypothetical protein